MIEKAKKTLERDYLLHVDMLELLRRGTAKVLYCEEENVLLWDEDATIYLMTSKDEEGTYQMMKLLPQDIDLMVVHQTFAVEIIKGAYSFTDTMECYNSVYCKKEMFDIQEGEVDLKVLDASFTELIAKHYSSLSTTNEKYIRERLQSGTMFGAFIKDQLCGFIGTHEEGSIGILEVLPPYRGKGIGELLQKRATNLALEEGRIPYGQIKVGNVPSLKLQHKLGYELSTSTVFWLFQ